MPASKSKKENERLMADILVLGDDRWKSLSSRVVPYQLHMWYKIRPLHINVRPMWK